MKISCIIPSYNEGERIEAVLKAVSGHPLIDECIVVDDGSKDNTGSIVKKFPDIKYILHSKNQGKATAMCTGIKASSGDKLLFIDADLVGLTPQNVTELITPVKENKADITISLRINTPLFWRFIGLDHLSGERLVPRDLLEPKIDEILKLPGFGIETYMDTLIIKKCLRIKIVKWPNVISPWKHEKNKTKGMWQKIKAEAPMMFDIFKTASLPKIIYIIVHMLQLRISK